MQFFSDWNKTRRNHIFSSNQPLESKFHLTWTIINTRWEAMQMVMAAQLSRFIQRIAPLQHLVAESCTTYSYQSYRWFRELLNNPPCEVLTAVTIETVAFWNVKRCIMVVIYRRFRGTYYFHLQDRRQDFLSVSGHITILKSLFPEF